MKNTIKIDDPEIINMDPVQKMWLYNNWMADQFDNAELAKNHAYLLASFWNPEAVQQLVGDSNVHISTEEEYEESLRMVKDQSLKLMAEQKPISRRKRRNLKQE